MRRVFAVAAISTFSLGAFAFAQMKSEVPVNSRPRARDLGIRTGTFETGPLNAITDVPGVRVGQTTIISGDAVRTGVTAILPHSGNVFREKVAAAIYVFNAFGKLVGSTQVQELGQMETPVVLTNTLSVWDAAAATADWMLTQPGNEDVRSINPVVGETNDGSLNDIRGRQVRAEHVRQALDSAKTGPIEEGSVGAGTGTIAFGWKGGIGTSSRKFPERAGGYTIGVLVQTNFGGRLTIDGVPVWRSLRPGRDPSASSSLGTGGRSAADQAGLPAEALAESGSCMIVVATDAPLDARQLHRLAARAIHGMARTGSTGSHGSGDFVIAFSTTNRYFADPSAQPKTPVTLVREDDLSPLFSAVIDATEEAIYNSLLRATTVRGAGGHVAEAIPIDKLRELLASRPPAAPPPTP